VDKIEVSTALRVALMDLREIRTIPDERDRFLQACNSICDLTAIQPGDFIAHGTDEFVLTLQPTNTFLKLVAAFQARKREKPQMC
jgi:hypothetical protein